MSRCRSTVYRVNESCELESEKWRDGDRAFIWHMASSSSSSSSCLAILLPHVHLGSRWPVKIVYSFGESGTSGFASLDTIHRHVCIWPSVIRKNNGTTDTTFGRVFLADANAGQAAIPPTRPGLKHCQIGGKLRQMCLDLLASAWIFLELLVCAPPKRSDLACHSSVGATEDVNKCLSKVGNEIGMQ